MERLPVTQVIAEAARSYWGLRREIARAMALPVALYLIIYFILIFPLTTEPLWRLILGLDTMIVVAFAAVSCHRVLLLGPVSIPRLGTNGTHRRDWLFIIAALSVFLFAQLIAFVVAVAFWPFDASLRRYILEFHEVAVAVFPWEILAPMLAGAYIAARLSVQLPSIAVDRPLGMRDSWRLSARNGWRLVLLVIVLPALLWATVTALSVTLPNYINLTLSAALSIVVLPFQIGLLSMSYRHLINRRGA